MDIYEIKELTKETSPYFFDKKTLKFFGQTMRSFKVSKDGDRYRITAPIKDQTGRHIKDTIRWFNPASNELERD